MLAIWRALQHVRPQNAGSRAPSAKRHGTEPHSIRAKSTTESGGDDEREPGPEERCQRCDHVYCRRIVSLGLNEKRSRGSELCGTWHGRGRQTCCICDGAVMQHHHGLETNEGPDDDDGKGDDHSNRYSGHDDPQSSGGGGADTHGSSAAPLAPDDTKPKAQDKGNQRVGWTAGNDNWPLHGDTVDKTAETARNVWMTHSRAWLLCAGLRRALEWILAPALRRLIASYLIANSRLQWTANVSTGSWRGASRMKKERRREEGRGGR